VKNGPARRTWPRVIGHGESGAAVGRDLTSMNKRRPEDAGEHFFKCGDFFAGPWTPFQRPHQGAELGEVCGRLARLTAGGPCGCWRRDSRRDRPSREQRWIVDFGRIGALCPGEAGGSEVFPGSNESAARR